MSFLLRSLRRSTLVARSTALTARPLSASLPRYAQKDAQDKDSLKPRSTEYSKSGSDDDAASGDAAFNPNKTAPESQLGEAEGESGNVSNKDKDPSSLNVSPGNPEVSQPRNPQEGGAESSPGDSNSNRSRTSGGGSAPKSGGDHSG